MANETILLVEDDEDMGMLIRHVLKAAGYNPTWTKDGVQAIMLAKQIQPHLIISDFMFPAGGGAAFHQRVRMFAHTASIPILIFTAIPQEVVRLTVAWDANTHYHAKPYKRQEFVDAVGAILGGQCSINVTASPVEEKLTSNTETTAQATILVVEDDKGASALLRHALESHGYTVVEANESSDAMRKLGLEERQSSAAPLKPDIIILDVVLPGMDGYTLNAHLLQNDRTKAIPVLIVTAKRGMKEVFQTSANVVAVLEKPLDAGVLRKHVNEILAHAHKLRVG